MSNFASYAPVQRRLGMLVLAVIAVLLASVSILQVASAAPPSTLYFAGTMRTKVNAQLNTANDYVIEVNTSPSPGLPLTTVAIDTLATTQGALVIDTSDTATWKAPIKSAAETWTIQSKAVNSATAGVYIGGVLKPLNTGATLTVKFLGGVERPRVYLKLTGFTPSGIGTGKLSIEAETAGTGAIQQLIITAVEPDGATAVPSSQGIVVHFSEVPGAFDPNGVIIDCGSGPIAFTVVNHGSFVEFIPVDPLPPGSVCTVTIPKGTATDTDPNDGTSTLPHDYQFEFEVDAAPEVTGHSPVPDGDVPTDEAFTVTFSESVDLAPGWFTASCSGGFSATPLGSESGIADYTIDVGWPAGVTCTVTVHAAKVTDADTADAPDNMVTDYVFEFTTDAAPSIVSVEHILGPVIGLIPTFVVEFSEPVNVAPALLPLYCSISGPLGLGVTLGGVDTTTIYVTTASVVAGDECTLTIPAGAVSDADDVDPVDTMVSDYQHIYEVDTAPQLVSSSSPQTVVKNTQVTVSWVFDEPVDAALTFVRTCGTGIFPSVSFIPASFSNTNTIFYTFTRSTAQPCTVSILGVIGDTDLGDPPNLFVGLLPSASVTFTN